MRRGMAAGTATTGMTMATMGMRTITPMTMGTTMATATAMPTEQPAAGHCKPPTP